MKKIIQKILWILCCILADNALSYDDKLSEAYYVRGAYYWEKGNINTGREGI